MRYKNATSRKEHEKMRDNNQLLISLSEDWKIVIGSTSHNHAKEETKISL